MEKAKYGLKGIPTFRILDYEKATSFYIDNLGFCIDWEHRFGPDEPVYMQVSKSKLILHLTENTRFQVGNIIFVETKGLGEYKEELQNFEASSLEILTTPWGTKQMEVEDPFGNLLRFNENIEE